MIVASVFLEWMNAYIFILDWFVLITFAVYIWEHYPLGLRAPQINLAVGLCIYMLGQTCNRILQWALRFDVNHQLSMAWVDTHIAFLFLVFITCTITVGLMCITRVVVRSFWFPALWPWCVCLAAGLSAAVTWFFA